MTRLAGGEAAEGGGVGPVMVVEVQRGTSGPRRAYRRALRTSRRPLPPGEGCAGELYPRYCMPDTWSAMAITQIDIGTRPARLSELIYDAIHEAIISQRLAPGAAISEVALARALNVSKTPVREALMRLREIRLVEPAGTQGLRVVLPSRSRLVEAYETRLALETAACSLAAQRRTEAESLELRALASATVTSATDSPSEFRERDKAFHLAVLTAAHSAYLEHLAKGALTMTGVLRARDVPVSGDSIQCAHEHLAIADAIAAGDRDAAVGHMQRHIIHVQNNVVAAFDATYADGKVSAG